MNTLLNILTIMEAIACATAFACWRKISKTYWQWFAVYLLFILLSELMGWYLEYEKMLDANFVFYGYLVIPVEFLFFFWLFYQSFKTSGYKWMPKACTIIYLLSCVADITYFNKRQYSFYSISYTVGNFLLLLLILSYFIQLVTTNAILNFKKDMLFWISTGLLIYFLGTFPYYGLRNTLWHNYETLYISYTKFTYLLDSLMYFMFILSFIWGKPKSSSL